MTAILHEPADEPTLPVVPVTAEAFDAIAREGGAVIELDPAGRAHVVIVQGVEYVCEVAS